MFGLSAEQQRKIEENKAAALLKKQQFIQKEKCASLPLNPTSSLNNTRENFIQNKTVKKELPIKQNVGYTHATFSIVSDDKFIADMNYHEPSIEIFKTIPGRLYGKQILFIYTMLKNSPKLLNDLFHFRCYIKEMDVSTLTTREFSFKTEKFRSSCCCQCNTRPTPQIFVKE